MAKHAKNKPCQKRKTRRWTRWGSAGAELKRGPRVQARLFSISAASAQTHDRVNVLMFRATFAIRRVSTATITCSPFILRHRPTAYSHLPREIMPPKRAASSKRKADASDSEDHGEGASPKAATIKTKKAKVDSKEATETSSDPSVAPNGQPTNKVLPVTISFPPKTLESVRIASWNICGLAASQKKVRSVLVHGLRYWYA